MIGGASKRAKDKRVKIIEGQNHVSEDTPFLNRTGN